MSKSFGILKKELDNGVFRPFYIFTGEEKEVMFKYIKRIDPNPKTVEHIEQFKEIARSSMLFRIGGTFVLHNNRDILQATAQELLSAVEQSGMRLILCFDKIDSRVKFFKELKGFIVEFEKYTEQQLSGYIQGIIDVDSRLASIIAVYCGNDVARIEMECDKLQRSGKEITLELVNELIMPSPEDKIFEMVDSLLKKDKERTFELFRDLKELKESPIKMVSIIYTKIKQVLQVQMYADLDNVSIAGKTGLSFYQINMTKELIGKHSLDELASMLKLVQETEVKMKTGQVDIDLGMEFLLLKILQ